MRNMRVRVALLAATLVAAGMGLWWVVPVGAGAQQVQCQLATPPLQPEHALELETVASGVFFKHVVMEKEVFECEDETGALQIHDLQTFIEIVQRSAGEPRSPWTSESSKPSASSTSAKPP